MLLILYIINIIFLNAAFLFISRVSCQEEDIMKMSGALFMF